MPGLLNVKMICREAVRIFSTAYRSDPTFAPEKEFHSVPIFVPRRDQYSIGFYLPPNAMECGLEEFASRWLFTATNRLIARLPNSALDCDPINQRLVTVENLPCAVETFDGVTLRLTMDEYPVLSLAVPSSWGTWKPWYNVELGEEELRHVGTVMRIDVRAIRAALPL